MAHAKGKIRVSFVCFNAYKLFNPHSNAQIGGTELQMYTLATTLAQHDRFQVSCIVGDFGQPRIERYKEVAVISAFRLNKTLFNLLFAPIYFFRALLVCKPDIVISSPAGPEVGLLALYCMLFPSTKYIFRTASDVDCDGQKEKTFDVLSRFLYRLGIAHANKIVAQHTKQQVALRSSYSKDSEVISNGYVVPAHTIEISQRPHRILWVGSSRKVKRADLFFLLVENFPEYQFDMVLSQSGNQTLFAEYKTRASEFSNLTFHGELSPGKTNALIGDSRLLLGTSDYEGSPNTYIIASLYGTPIISLNVECRGVYVRGDYNRMKQEIKKILEDNAYAEKIASQELLYAKKHYDMNYVIEHWISVIQEMYYSQTN